MTTLRSNLVSVMLAACLTVSVAADEKPLTDRVISLAVENELLASDAIKAHRLDATSREGVVTLSGKVDNLLAKGRATELARQVKGVMAVINEIVVLPGDREDEDVARDVQRALSADHATGDRGLKVAVKFGTATLTGTVDSYAAKSLAEDVATGVAGITGIENKIEVESKSERPAEKIREEIRALIESAVELDDEDVTVRVEGGDVVLSGRVGSALAKFAALRKAWVAGVNSVDARGVRVDPDLYDGTRRRQRMEAVTDETIVATVELALRQDPRVFGYMDTIEVASESGFVTLAGSVDRLRAKDAAGKTAQSTIGVWRVKNNLKVRWSDEEPTAEDIIKDVQEALKRDPYVSRHDVRVHCRNAHVGLYGVVDTEFERKAAGWIVGGQKGVVHVDNYLAVAERWEPKTDAAIKADVEEKLKFTFFDKSNAIEVTVVDGVAILRGEVDTWMAWQTAMNKAIEAGARRPHNLLKVRYHPRHGGSRIYVPD